MIAYSFFFAPTGAFIVTIHAKSLKEAKSDFYKNLPQYRKAKGEVYVSWQSIGRLWSKSLSGRNNNNFLTR